jgi:hypothetical protein
VEEEVELLLGGNATPTVGGTGGAGSANSISGSQYFMLEEVEEEVSLRNTLQDQEEQVEEELVEQEIPGSTFSWYRSSRNS